MYEFFLWELHFELHNMKKNRNYFIFFLQLAAPGRHIVFSGEMDFVDNWKWVKAQVFLMNDVIIVTKREPDSTISIIAEPIFLKDVHEHGFRMPAS